MSILTLWPIIKWALQALGMMGPEDKEAERTYRLKLLEAEQRKDAAMIEAFAEFQKLWRPGADRVYVWANTVIALFQPLVIAGVYWDVFLGAQKSVSVADRLGNTAGGLFVLSIMLFPFYGPALVKGVSVLFEGAAQMVLERKTGKAVGKPTVSEAELERAYRERESERERLERLNRERNDAIIREGSTKPDDVEPEQPEHDGIR